MNTRLAFVDTLRGVAVGVVLLQHSLEQIILTQTTGAYEWALQDITGYYFNLGRFGVVLFFFVSGFVIPNSFPDGPAPIRDFAISRFFRLYPTYWLSVLLAVLILPITEQRTFSSSTILANLTMLQTFLNVPNLRTAYWTLAIELIFYSVCICLFFAGVLRSRMTAVYMALLICVPCVAMSLLIRNHIALRLMEVALDLAAMFTGKVMRDTVIERTLGWRYAFLCLLAFVSLSIVLPMQLYGGHYDKSTFFYGYSIASAYASAAILFVVFCVFKDRLSPGFSIFTGRISYSIYLIHAYVLSVLVYAFGAGKNPLQWTMFLLSVVGLSILVSCFTYAFVEKPAIAFGRRFRSRPQRAVPGTPLEGRVVEH